MRVRVASSRLLPVVVAAALMIAGCGGANGAGPAAPSNSGAVGVALRGWESALAGFGFRLDVCAGSVTPSPGFWSGCVRRERGSFHARTLAVRRALDQGGDGQCHRTERPARQLVDDAAHTLTAASTATGRALRRVDHGSSADRSGQSPAPLLSRADAIVSRSRRIAPRLISAVQTACR
jgi:hypothetical protein